MQIATATCSIATALLLLLCHIPQHAGESDDDSLVERFCYPDAHKNTRQSCECSNVSEPPWGLPAVHIDCSYKDFKSNDIASDAATLPLYIDTLDLSWNAIDKVPQFASSSLRLLNLMHNNVTALQKKNFANVLKLRELYLGWNSIQTIEAGAFDGLSYLVVLDLSHNNLRALSYQLFAPLQILESLSLSWNRQLNQTEGIMELDFYQTFGVNSRLRTLRLQACGLSDLVLHEKAQLNELDLRYNRFTKMPSKLPLVLQKLDMSQNLFDTLTTEHTKRLAHLHELYLEDMPNLQSIAENSFVPLLSLEKVSFQNSRRLKSFDAYAFGVNSTQTEWPLKTMIFRGTTLRSFNATLAPVFTQLTVLDLNGMPLHCYCELIWVKELKLETNGRCFMPARLRGMRLSNAHASDFSCDRWPRWVYGLMILSLIILCACAIYLLVMGLRPHRGVTLRTKVGAGSPYARVTIELKSSMVGRHFNS